MTEYTETLAKVLARSFHAVNEKPMFGESPKYAAQVLEVLLPYHGLAVIWVDGLVVQGDWPYRAIELHDDGIELPTLPERLSPDLAHRLGQALIAAARIAREPR